MVCMRSMPAAVIIRIIICIWADTAAVCMRTISAAVVIICCCSAVPSAVMPMRISHCHRLSGCCKGNCTGKRRCQ